jgi:hypothetical protein
MSGAYALGRLLWRPLALWTLFPLFWAVAVPLLVLGEGGSPVSGLWRGVGTEAVRTAAWHVAVLVPAVFGLAVSIARLELQYATFSWMLPGVRQRLRAGTVLAALVAAVSVALLVAHTAPGAVAVGALLWSAFAVAILCFATLSSAMDAAFPRLVRWTAFVAVAAAAVRPGAVRQLAESWPWLTGLFALVCAALLVAVQFSERSARSRHFRWSAMGSAGPGRRMLYWATRRSAPPRPWVHSLATTRLGPWLHAAAYEGSGRGAPARVVLIPAVAVLWAQLTANPAMAAILVGLFLVQGGMGLRSTLPYPLSRARRAELAAAGALVEAAAFVLVMSAAALAVHLLQVPVLPWFADEMPARAGWPAVIGLTFAWAPVAQWAAVRWPANSRNYQDVNVRAFLPLMPYALAVAVSARILLVHDAAVTAGVIMGLVVVVRLAWWAAVRRHFATAKL